MIENCYIEIKDAIKYRNKYPISNVYTMESIVNDAFDWVNKRFGIPNVEHDLIFLTEDKSEQVIVKLYLLVMKNKLTKEYLVGTIRYVSNKKNLTQKYEFEVLEYREIIG